MKGGNHIAPGWAWVDVTLPTMTASAIEDLSGKGDNDFLMENVTSLLACFQGMMLLDECSEFRQDICGRDYEKNLRKTKQIISPGMEIHVSSVGNGDGGTVSTMSWTRRTPSISSSVVDEQSSVTSTSNPPIPRSICCENKNARDTDSINTEGSVGFQSVSQQLRHSKRVLPTYRRGISRTRRPGFESKPSWMDDNLALR